MALVPAKCTSCNGTLEVDATQKAAICPFCGSAYVVQDAIEQYNITNVYKIDNANLKVDHKQLFSDRIEAAEKQLKVLKDYSKALNSFAALENDVPEDFRIWSGQLEAQTNGYNPTLTGNIYVNNKDYLPQMLRNYEHAYQTGNNEQRTEINAKFINLLKQCSENIQSAEKILTDNSKKRSKYRNKSIFWVTVGIIFIALTLAIIAPISLMVLPTIIGIVNSVDADTTKFGILLLLILLAPIVLSLLLAILSFVFRNKNKKKDKAISAETARILTEELHLNFPGFAPMEEYKNLIDFCQKKIAFLQNAIEKHTIRE